MLLEIRFLNGYYGADINKDLDYPPSPGRLFSALTHAFTVMGNNLGLSKNDREINRKVLLWFEELCPPDIIFPKMIQQKSTPTVFVPINEVLIKDKKNRARKFPVAHAENNCLYYQWENVEPHDKFEELLMYLSCLGTSRSMIEARLVPELPEHANDFIHFKPTKDGAGKRIPCYHPGRLEISDDSYSKNTRTPQTKHVGYKQHKPVIPGLMQTSNFFRLEDGPYKIHNTETALLANAVRGKLLNIARRLNLAPNALIGHEPKSPHMAFLSLPFIGRDYKKGDKVPEGNQFATGMIMGMNITIPKMIHSQERDECWQIMNQFILQDGIVPYRNEQWKLTPVLYDGAPYTLKSTTWNKPSKFWKSVTPAEINWKKGSKYIYELCQKLNLPVSYVKIQELPNFSGSCIAKDYVSRNENRRFYKTHFIIEFSEEIKGPLYLGNTANYGLGLLKPIEEDVYQSYL